MATQPKFRELTKLLSSVLKEQGPYTPCQRFERFVGFITQDLPVAEAKAKEEEWKLVRQEIAAMAVEELDDIDLSVSDKEEFVCLMLCNEAMERVPGWWHLFEDDLAKRH